MKITALETIRLAAWGNAIWVRVHTDDGPIGLGETWRGIDAVEAQIHGEIAPRLIGRDPRAIDAIAKDLTEPYVGFGAAGAEMRAASAIDIALWDVLGQATGQPIHQLLGGLTRPKIRTYNTCAGYTYNQSGTRREILRDTRLNAAGPYEDQQAFMTDAGALAKSLLAEGVGAMKIWPFDPFAARSGGQHISAAEIEEGLRPFRQIRDAVGDAMDVMVELHSMWELPPALAIARALREIRPYWCEDPIKMLDADALASYAQRGGVPVCASETLATRAGFLEILRKGAVDFVMLDLGWCGGLGEAKKIATMAEAFQRPVAPHDCTGPVVFAASIHLAVNAPNCVFQESVRAYVHGWYREIVTVVPRVENGFCLPMEGPGLGTALQPDVTTRPGARVRITRAGDL